jgi:probable F420-dependent oxidoreductase
VKFGALMFPTADTIQPVPLGRALEARGFESLWLSEHSHIPVSRRSPFGGREDAPPLPSFYWHLYESLIALTAVAGATQTLRLATGIALLAQRDPLWTAKQVATLDTLSGGRCILGIGYGWNREELADHGVRFDERRAVLREKVLAMKALWTLDEAQFDGEHVRFEPSWAWPKPVQKPHPPIVLGAGPGPRTFAHIIEFCDGWMPNFGRYDLEAGLAGLRTAAENAGRDPDSIELSITTVGRDAAQIDALRAQGMKRIVFSLRPNSPDEVLRDLDVCAELISQFATD